MDMAGNAIQIWREMRYGYGGKCDIDMAGNAIVIAGNVRDVRKCKTCKIVRAQARSVAYSFTRSSKLLN